MGKSRGKAESKKKFHKTLGRKEERIINTLTLPDLLRYHTLEVKSTIGALDAIQLRKLLHKVKGINYSLLVFLCLWG